MSKKEKAIRLVNDIIKNMEYIKLLLVEEHKYIAPLNTYYVVKTRLQELKDMLSDGE